MIKADLLLLRTACGRLHPRRGTQESPRTISHAEPRTPDSFDGGGGPTDLHVCRALPTEEIEQQLARKSDDTNRGLPVPGSDDLVRPRPLELERGVAAAGAGTSPDQLAAASASSRPGNCRAIAAHRGARNTRCLNAFAGVLGMGG